MERRLAAVMIADVAGYGRMSRTDEEGTRARFQSDLHEVFEPRIAAHHGRLVKTMGDGLLVEFHSVVDALRCAVEIQRTEAERNAGVPADRRLRFRIGINLGDVIVEGDDIHGDGVNIADRLQNLAEPGGITVSGSAYDQVRTKLAVGYADLGRQAVKNVDEPVQAYRVLLDPAAAGRTLALAPASRQWRWAKLAAGFLILVAGAGIVAWVRPWEPRIEPASVERMALPLPDKPSIVVLPFTNMSGDPQQDYFADGIAENLTTDLSSLSGLFVIARNTAFTYKGKTVTPARVAEELGVRYLIEGSVQRSGDVVRINAQLIDAVSGGHAWADRFDGSLDDIFALQDRVTAEVVRALEIRLTPGEQTALRQHETNVPAAYDAFLRGWEHYQRTTPVDFAQAIPQFEQAIALDPSYGRAHAALAMVYFRSFDQGWTASLGHSATEAYEIAKKHLLEAKNRPTSTSHQLAGNIARNRGWHEEALKEFKAAIAIEPNDSWNYAYLAYALVYADRPDEAADAIETALRLDPSHPPVFVYYRGLVQFAQNRLDDAAQTFEQGSRLSPDDPWPLLYLAATYGLVGRNKEAAAVLAGFDAARVRQGGVPFVTDEITYTTENRFVRPPQEGRLMQGLLRAGAPRSFADATFASQRLTGAEVDAVFFDRRVHGRTFQTGQEHGASVSGDGVAVMFGDWGSGSGTARLDGDQLCFDWETTMHCGKVFRNPGGTREKENEYIWTSGFSHGIGFPFSPVD
jgi:TolB-like protein/class 3 adenylate cyclase/Tfp pilus assembly protein PilF